MRNEIINYQKICAGKEYCMLKQWIPGICPEEEELNKRLDEAVSRLEALQLKIKEKKLPVLVLVEGWGAAGRAARSAVSFVALTRAFSK